MIENQRAKLTNWVDVGLLARGEFQDAIASGRAMGLEIDVHQGGGFLVRRYWIVIRGDLDTVRRWQARWPDVGSLPSHLRGGVS